MTDKPKQPKRTPMLYVGSVVALRDVPTLPSKDTRHRMTVEAVDRTGKSVKCCWHDAAGNLHRDHFVNDSLELLSNK